MPRVIFEEWMKSVDAALLALCGLSHDDLPDYGYRDAYDDGRNPRAVAKSALKAAKES